MPARHSSITSIDSELEALYAGSEDALARLGPDGRIERWSRAAEDLYGYAEHEVRGHSLALLEPCGAAELDAAVAAARAGSLVRFATEHVHRRGRRLEVEVTLVPFCGDLEGGEFVVMIVRDLGRVRNLERELTRISQAIDLASDALLSVDLEGHLRHWNLGAERLFGISADEAIGCRAADLDAVLGEPASSKPRWSQTIAGVIDREAPAQLVVRRRLGDGRIADLLVRLAPWRIAGAIVGVTALIIDITAERSAGADSTPSA